MKKVLTFLGIGLLLFSVNSFAGNYTVDQNKIDAMFANATDITAVAAYDLGDLQTLPLQNAQLDEKNEIVALVLAGVLGGFGIHRLYLGTKAVNVVIYIAANLLFGAGAILGFIDAIFILLAVIDDEKSIAPFVDNPKLIMWSDQM